MKHTRQIIRYTALTAAAVIAACALAGCTRSDTSTSDNSAGSGNSSGNVVAGAGEKVQSTAAQQDSSQTVQDAGSVQADSSSVQETTQSTAAQQDSSQTVQDTGSSQDNGTVQTQETAAQSQTSAETTQTAAASEDDEEAVYDGQETFTGYYEKPDGTESVNIVLVNDNAIQFSFTNSHISATADVDGDMAVYHGDDDYTITFTVADDELGVAVSGADADQSSMNGVYFRSSGDDSGEDYIVVDDEEDTEDDDTFYVSDTLD